MGADDLEKQVKVIIRTAESVFVNEDWYGDQFKGTFLTDAVIPSLFACVPLVLPILFVLMWSNHG